MTVAAKTRRSAGPVKTSPGRRAADTSPAEPAPVDPVPPAGDIDQSRPALARCGGWVDYGDGKGWELEGEN